ncbi:MAG: class I SAM-dependent methyltransferase [Chloroflexi bacterium]|nr:MAG: class I SAM-dependent methyltransferase [Chloroflexota bacterium]
MRSSYDVDDPEKIQGRDDIELGKRNLATTRLERGLRALSGVQGSVLILGAGAGRYPRAISRHRPDLLVVAGDISHRAVAEADARRGKVSYLVMDAQRLPFVEESFNAVVFFDLLEHVPDPDQLLRECARVLSPGGLLHFYVPLEDEPMTLYRLFKRDTPVPIHQWKREHVGHIQRFTRRDVVRRVWDAGLEVSLAESSFHLVGQVHDIVDYWQRERRAGGHGIVPLRGVDLVARATFLVTWRLSWAEDRVLHTALCASGLHITAHKPAELDV